MMLLTIDNLANRYGILPSEALERGSTFDLHVLDLSSKWIRHQQDESENSNSRSSSSKKLTKEQMFKMMEHAKNLNKGGL